MDNKKLLRLMKNAGFNTVSLSKATGISVSTLNKIVYGVTTNPTIDNLQNIARALGCGVDDFLDSEEEESSSQIHTIAAHHDGDWTQEELDEIEEFKRYILSKRKNK